MPNNNKSQALLHYFTFGAGFRLPTPLDCVCCAQYASNSAAREWQHPKERLPYLQVKPPRFQPVVQLRGCIRWSCPNCGHINKSRLSPQSYRVVCAGHDCRVTWEHGSTFRAVCKSRNSRARPAPRDLLLDLAPYRVSPMRPAILLPVREHARQEINVVLVDQPE